MKQHDEKIVLVNNQNDIRLCGVTSFNAFASMTSSSRGQMQSNALGQHTVLLHPEPNSIQTGAEMEYGRYTTSIRAEENIKVVAVIDRYLPSPNNGIQFNPQRVVITQEYIEGRDKPSFGVIDINRISHNHPKFGFDYKPTEHASQIRAGNTIKKGTVLYDTPAKDALGNYSVGRDLNVCYLSLPGNIEDSLLINEDVADLMAMKVFTTRTFELGENEFPLNLYGDDDNYKVMPEIGEICHPTGLAYNGLIMAKRQYQPELLPITFSKTATRQYDSITDFPLDGNGDNAKVIDIIVYKQSKVNSYLSPKVLQQLDKYAMAYTNFCERIIVEYRNIKRKHPEGFYLSDELAAMICHAMAIVGGRTNDEKLNSIPIQKTSNFNRKLDDYTIIITTETIKKPKPGNKYTGFHGNKGVLAKIVPSNMMPRDVVTGQVADITISSETPTNRMNYGQIMEMTLKKSMVELYDWISQTTGLNKGTPQLKEKVYKLPQEVLETVFNRVERFYELTSEVNYNWYSQLSFQDKTSNLYHTLKDKVYLWLPTNNNRSNMHMVKNLKEEGYLSPPNHLTYYNPYLDRWETTASPCRIGQSYFIALEKIADDAAAVSTASTQPNGIIVPITAKDKARQQVRRQATKFPGESEFRTLLAGTPSGTSAEIHDRSNNRNAIRHALNTIYSTGQPTMIKELINRDEVPLGSNTPLQILKHFMGTNGIKMVYQKFDPNLRGNVINPNTENVFSVDEDDDNKDNIDLAEPIPEVKSEESLDGLFEEEDTSEE